VTLSLLMRNDSVTGDPGFQHHRTCNFRTEQNMIMAGWGSPTLSIQYDDVILLLLHGSSRSHEHPVKEPNVAHGVITS